MGVSKAVIYKADCAICAQIAASMSEGRYSAVQCLRHARPCLADEINLFERPSEDTNLQEFVTKDSGERVEFVTGMKRDIQTNKPRYDLLDKPMLKRWAELMSRGAEKYGENNWRKAETQEELNRFEASLLRHAFQLLEGDRSEDHGAAICFNVAGYEMVRAKLEQKNG